MTSIFPCTCQEPCLVDLDISAPDFAETANTTSRALLLNNLKRFGWTPLRCFGVGTESPSHEAIQNLFRMDHDHTSDTSGFENGAFRHRYDPRLTYRAAESGGHEQIIEPKESLELEQSKLIAPQNEKDSPTEDHVTTLSSSHYDKVRNWCLAMSGIAQKVNSLLGLPPNIFLVDDSDEATHYSPSERLDLLRVFNYHVIPKAPDHQQQKQQLGSSPHTDWGSWTVVWQDSVGGLETYCRKCQRWIPVATIAAPPPAADDHLVIPPTDIWDCIIHVGDMSSLALGWAPPSIHVVDEKDENKVFVVAEEAQWPSPRHRVLSPSQSERTSLVYFAYPPASCSIRKMQDALQNHETVWNPTNDRDRRLPLSEYYLLKDQSAAPSISTSDSEDRAKAVYEKLQSMTIKEAIQEKWKQVQRE
jgi:isopenicillin N synthase-like dioxygenase